jgi:hypothetical protein
VDNIKMVAIMCCVLRAIASARKYW